MSTVSQSTLPVTESLNDSGHLSLGFTRIAEDQKEMLQFFSQTSGMMIQGMCRFEKSFAVLFPLFKGLISLGKPKGLNLTFSTEEKAAFFYFPVESNQDVSLFFNRVIALLKKEVRFKLILKEVITNRNRFKSEQILLQQAFFDKTTN
ncbi:MAG: hypothetical protein PSV36_01410 [Algoriphagus sp.]|nr:hypothetical protein [Algoriphagus sp.]